MCRYWRHELPAAASLAGFFKRHKEQPTSKLRIDDLSIVASNSTCQRTVCVQWNRIVYRHSCIQHNVI